MRHIKTGTKVFFAAILATVMPHSTAAKDFTLRKNIVGYVNSCRADIGVAVITDRHDTICVNNAELYPMNSVMKLYQAMAAADVLQRKGTPPDTAISIGQEEIHPTTYSPMRDRLPKGKIRMTVSELLKFSLQQSDNNACDILFGHIAGIAETNKYISSIGIEDFKICATEREMFSDNNMVYKNICSPLSAAMLINRLFTGHLFTNEYQRLLTETLNGCSTGTNRLPKPLIRTNAIIGHKTGTGFTSSDGFPQGINDVGFVQLPNGRHYSIAVFIKSSRCGMEETEQMIADISEIVYKAMSGR